MTVYILFNIDSQRIIYTSTNKDAVEAMLMDGIRGRLSFKNGRYYSPLVIYDAWVHTKDCGCSKCTGLEDEE